jgi:hypothetical protein
MCFFGGQEEIKGGKDQRPRKTMTTAFSHLEGVTPSIDVARFLIRIGFHCADLTCLVALPLNGESSLFLRMCFFGGQEEIKGGKDQRPRKTMTTAFSHLEGVLYGV